MTTFKLGACVMTLLASTAVAVAPPPSTPGSTSTRAPIQVSWLNAGDSYSSGEGLTDDWGWIFDTGTCAQSELAYGEQAVRILTEEKGWQITPHEFVACTGSTLREFYGPTNDPDDANNGRGPQWTQATAQSGRSRFDVITMSFGGNNILFGDVMKHCVSLWGERQSWDEEPGPQCDVSQAELEQRIDQFIATTAEYVYVGAGPLDAVVDADSFAEQERLSDFYARVVRTSLTPTGRLVVVGYPALFAPFEEWPDVDKGPRMCGAVSKADAEMMGKVAVYFEQQLEAAVDRANDDLGEDRVVYVSRLDLFRGNELCSGSEPYLIGFLGANIADGFRYVESYHPNQAGHAETAREVARVVAAAFDSTPSTDPPPTATPTPDPPDPWLLSVAGIGPYRIGMTGAELLAAGLLADAGPNELCGDPNTPQGRHYLATGEYASAVGPVFREGVMMAVGASSPLVHSPAGAHVGMYLDDLERIYGSAGQVVIPEYESDRDNARTRAFVVQVNGGIEVFYLSSGEHVPRDQITVYQAGDSDLLLSMLNALDFHGVSCALS